MVSRASVQVTARRSSCRGARRVSQPYERTARMHPPGHTRAAAGSGTHSVDDGLDVICVAPRRPAAQVLRAKSDLHFNRRIGLCIDWAPAPAARAPRPSFGALRAPALLGGEQARPRRPGRRRRARGFRTRDARTFASVVSCSRKAWISSSPSAPAVPPPPPPPLCAGEP